MVKHENHKNILTMVKITKSFPGVKALDNVSFSMNTGEIHGLVGENGAGKSTLIKVLAGVYVPEQGEVVVGGKKIAPLTPATIHLAGVRFIHQELHLVPHFTVVESVFMGQELTSKLGPFFGLLKKDMKIKTEIFFKDVFGIEIDSYRLIKNLTVAERKMVQIARALIDDHAKVVVFDEPTATLDSKEAKKLIAIIKRLKQRNVAMIYVSHYLTEITDICDRCTVLRNGEFVSVIEQINSNSVGQLIKLMVGREITEIYPKKQRKSTKQISLKILNLGNGRNLKNINFTVYKGEIVGVAGLLGSGREELIDTIYGLKKRQTGEIYLGDSCIDIKSPVDSVSNGMVLVPRDRRKTGLVLRMDVQENINLGSYDKVASYTIEDKNKSKERAKDSVKNLDIRPAYLDVVAENFSGGNQQKIILGRWLCTDADMFIFDEPTAGVDIGAKSEIYQLIENLARKKTGVLLSSSDPAELIGLCDKIIVMKRGMMDSVLRTENLSINRLIDITTSSEFGTGYIEAK